MQLKDRSSVLLSIFRRKGGEGRFTKIIDEFNKKGYDFLSSYLTESEKPLIIYLKDLDNWILLTNEKIIKNTGGVISAILHTDIKNVKMALLEEHKNGVTDKMLFSLLRINDKYDISYLWDFEQGKPFQGFYQVLHFLSS